MQGDNVFVLAARRTPFGKFWGALRDTPAPRLGAAAIGQIVKDTGIKPEMIDGVCMGHVLTAGVGQHPARQAALHAGIPWSCPAQTVNKVCSSSLAALEDASNRIRFSLARFMVAGGMESMSQAPYLLRRTEKQFGDFTENHDMTRSDSRLFIDSMRHDGLLDTCGDLRDMGALADMCGETHKISREEQELFAYESFSRARDAHERRLLYSQIVRVKSGDREVSSDEGVRIPDLEKMKGLEPAFTNNGTVTSATSSQISDGAGALLLSSAEGGERLGIRPLARIVAFATYSSRSEWFTTAPVGAITRILEETNLSVEDIDLFEINEAFAVVPLYAMRKLDIPRKKVNIWGGAIAYGHPLGATGARIVATAIYGLIHTKGCYGIAAACNGGGEAMAVLVENLGG